VSVWSRSWVWVLRRVLGEVRAMRRAHERIADALELQGQGQGAGSPRAQVFRSHSRLKGEASERDLRDLTEVSYVDEAQLAAAYDKEAELTALLGRAPSETELARALAGELE